MLVQHLHITIRTLNYSHAFKIKQDDLSSHRENRTHNSAPCGIVEEGVLALNVVPETREL